MDTREKIAKYLYDKVYGRCGGIDWEYLWSGVDLKDKCLQKADGLLEAIPEIAQGLKLLEKG